jgi:hypothetical protein
MPVDYRVIEITMRRILLSKPDEFSPSPLKAVSLHLQAVDNILLGMEKADPKIHPNHCPTSLQRRRPPSRIKKAVISTLEDLWSREWRESSQGSTTRLFFPSPRCFTQLRFKYPSQQVIQILSGHSLLNSHKYRLKLVSSPSCACTFPCESIQHFIFDCPLYADLRVNFMSTCFSVFARGSQLMIWVYGYLNKNIFFHIFYIFLYFLYFLYFFILFYFFYFFIFFIFFYIFSYFSIFSYFFVFLHIFRIFSYFFLIFLNFAC